MTSERLIRTVVDSNNGDNGDTTRRNRFRNYLRNPNNYIIDYGDDGGAWIMFPPATKARVYTISYQYEVGQSAGADELGVQSPTEISIPASPVAVDDTTPNQYVWYRLAPGGVPVPSGNPTLSGPVKDGDAIQSGTDLVVRNFQRISGDDPATAGVEGDTWDPKDPYQYKLVSANVSPNANLGVIAFNPAGANYSVSVPGGVKPFTALVSYAVLDWHILHDDREVPVGGVVRTTLPNIRVRGDETVDLNATGAERTQVYPGLYPKLPIYTDPSTIPAASESPDIQLFNLSDASGTARLMVAGELANKATTDADADYWIDRGRTGGTYPSGAIYVNTSTNRSDPKLVVPAGSKVRILYKAVGDWAVAFQKAAKAYKQEEATGGSFPVANKSNVYAVSNSGTPSNFADDQIVFHRTELNKGVTASIEITTAAGITRLPVRQFSIQNAADAYAYANIAEIAPELKNASYKGSSITGWRVVGDINGASLKTRVIWQDGQNGRNRFRMADLETFVSRQAQ